MGGHIPRHVVPDVAISTLRLLLLIDLGVCLQAGPACYDPFGKLAVDDLPCNPTAVESFCCGAGWSCLTNQLCRDVEGGVEGGVEGSVARGTCTDKSWSSTECPDYCATQMGKFTSCSSNTYCCGDCDCMDSNQLYIIPGRNDPFTTVGESSVDNESVGSPPSPSSTYSFLTQSLTSAALTSTIPATSSAEPMDSTSASGTTRDLISPRCTPSTQCSGPNNSKKMVIGFSVSLGAVVVVFVLTTVWIFWRKRYKKEKTADPSDAYINPPTDRDIEESIGS